MASGHEAMFQCQLPPSHDAASQPETPPKTPGKSPRGARGSNTSTPSTGGALAAVAGTSPATALEPQKMRARVADKKGSPASVIASTALVPLLPFSIVEDVTRVIWAGAKSQILSETVVCSFPRSPKRRRSETVELVGAQSSPLVPSFSSQPSQPSQTSRDDEGDDASQSAGPFAAVAEDLFLRARGALKFGLRQANGDCGRSLADSEEKDLPMRRVYSMTNAALKYWREVSSDLSKASSSLACFLEHQRRLYWRRAPWRGVNLGGWLLLEPGPSEVLFNQYGPATCEWDLTLKMREKLGVQRSQMVLTAHRETFVTEDDFSMIKSMGLNAVRIPFGYWALAGPTHGEAFDGPYVEYLDRAIDWAEKHDLQVLLDLHGSPGGESGERPCGRQSADWCWKNWRFDESIDILGRIAERYRGRSAVTGVSVCNEPSEAVPAAVLCRFYDRAVTAIREAGMRPDEVAVTLPIFRTERLDEIWRIWNKEFDGFARHPNTAFDLHIYHCFGPWWKRQGLPQHLRMTKRHRRILRRVPAVVGEWSLALPVSAMGDVCDNGANSSGTSPRSPQHEDQAVTAFASSQVEAYSQASHGWFFWNWRDGCTERHHVAWDLRQCVQRQWLRPDQFVGDIALSNSAVPRKPLERSEAL